MIARSEMLTATFERKYEASPVEGLTKAEYVAKRYALVSGRLNPRPGRNLVSDAWSK